MTPPESRSSPIAASTSPRRRLADRLGRWAVVGGGLAIIVSILGILAFILVEVAPLLAGARVDEGREVGLGSWHPAALVTNEYRSQVAAIGSDGALRVIEVESGRTTFERPLLQAGSGSEVGAAFPSHPPAGVTVVPGRPWFVVATTDGRVVAQRIDWTTSFGEVTRRDGAAAPPPVIFPIDPEGRALGPFAATVDEHGAGLAASLLADGNLALVRRDVEENEFTGERSETWERQSLGAPADLLLLVVDGDRRNLYGGTRGGDVVWWPLVPGRTERSEVSPGGHGAVTAMTLLKGDRSLLVGHADGVVTVWFLVRQADESFRLTRIRELAAGDSAIRHLAPSGRRKGFLAADQNGNLALCHSTSERILWRGHSPVAPLDALAFAPRDDGALLAGPGGIIELRIDNAHPEVSWKALFGKVWYEGYDGPDHVWQSSGGTDDFEPKLSMTPLMIGTLKGTVYSLVLAIPLGVLGAMYASQFMHHELRRFVKPTVEIMAALPSVVLGFLAGLWLAPRVAQILPALVALPIVLPILVVVAGLAWRGLPPAVRRAVPDGAEALWQMAVVVLGAGLCLALNAPLERLVFGDSFPDWLREATGLVYDQRNAIVVGLAMGFAVIPIIFSIAEDAFSNVPRALVSGSLALGATRWQTVTRVVLPSASAGIFSAVMIGFGRAVGETMIVLMATGNTPIMDWSPFNGFRTLSANIAVEIPEAPQGDTLYRTLFLAALILFVFTFLTNTLAEIVRQRLRKRFAQL